MNFQLDIEIDETGLAKIARAGQFVTVFRSVRTFVSTADLSAGEAWTIVPVAWLAFQPLATNVLTWTDAADLYGVVAAPAAGGVITAQARTHGITPGQSSTAQDGAFGPPSVAPDPSAYRAVNRQQDFVCFGLIGTAMINGVAHPDRPMNIRSTLLNEAVDFTLDPGTILIALTTVGSDGTVVPAGVGGLQVSVSSNSPIAVGFEDTTNRFFVSSSARTAFARYAHRDI